MFRRDRYLAIMFEADAGGGAGASATPPAPAPAPAATPPAPAPAADGATLSQEQVNAIAARERHAGETAAMKQIAEDLGMDPAEAKKLLEAAKENERKAMTEADRKLAEAADKEAAAAKREAAADARELAADVKSALLGAGVPADKLARAQQLTIADLGDGKTEAEIKAAIESVKKDAPEWFAAAASGANGDGKNPPSGNPPGGTPRPTDNKGSADALGRGAEKAREMSKRRGGRYATAGAQGEGK